MINNNNMPVAGASRTPAVMGSPKSGQNPPPVNNLQPAAFVRCVQTANAGTQTTRALLNEHQLPPNLRIHSRVMPDVPSMPAPAYPDFPVRVRAVTETRGTQVPGQHTVAALHPTIPNTVHWVSDTPESYNQMSMVDALRR